MNTTSPVPATQRLLSLDTYRGIVMFTLFAGGFGLAQVAGKFPENETLQWLKFHTSHPEWISQFKAIGFSLWDMIQPAFMFMVGVSMPYSYGKRKELGHTYTQRLAHAWTRAIVLVLLGVFLQSMNKPETYWIFTNVLSQIGLGYGFLFFLVGRRFLLQLIIGAVVLVGYFFYMLPAGFENGTSAPQQFDLWFLNLFPRESEFTVHPYTTFNFIPSFVTMLMGVMSGQLLKNSEIPEATKLRRLLLGGLVCLLLALAWAPVCPIVKKLWTPSWALFSGAYVIWLLALLYWLIDYKGWKYGWTSFFIVVGMNSIAAYLMGQLMKPFVKSVLHTHIPDTFWAATGAWEPAAEAILIAVFFWITLLWMYRNRIFIRI
ncbi:MAG: DUF5009 domain-containing protein [Planctomycetaceae bacterium]|nr:DUF5009 domain-containing protein [Planctomycetaceae bacterium]